MLRRRDRGTEGLANRREHFLEPCDPDIEGFAALDSGEFYGAQYVVAFLILTDDTALPPQRAFDRVFDATPDQLEVRRVGRRCAGEVAALLDQDLFRSEHLRELFTEPLPGIDRVEFHVTEG